MPFSLQHKCLFIQIPSTSDVSFTKSLGLNEPTDDTPAQDLNGEFALQPLTEDDLPTIIPLQHLCMKQIQMLGVLDHSLITDSLKVAFVRNPWDRVMSFYSNHYHHHSVDFEDFIVKLERIVSFVNENFVFDFKNVFYKEYSELMISTLTEFSGGIGHSYRGRIISPYAKKSIWVDPHVFPQHLFIYDEFDNNLIDFVGRFENYSEDAQHILNRLGALRYFRNRAGVRKPLIPHLNSLTQLDYREAYNLKTRDIIYNIFKKDIQTFDYRF